MADDRRDEPRQAPISHGPRLHPATVGVVVLALAFLAFVLQNTDKTEVSWLFFDWSLPLWLLLVVTSAIGIAAFELGGWIIRRARRGD